MGKYNDIWLRVNEYEKSEKKRKSTNREEKRKQLEEKKNEEIIAQVEDLSLSDEMVEGEETLPLWITTDYKVIKNYEVPPFDPGTPNLTKNGALKKYKDRFGKFHGDLVSGSWDMTKQLFKDGKYIRGTALSIWTGANKILHLGGELVDNIGGFALKKSKYAYKKGRAKL